MFTLTDCSWVPVSFVGDLGQVPSSQVQSVLGGFGYPGSDLVGGSHLFLCFSNTKIIISNRRLLLEFTYASMKTSSFYSSHMKLVEAIFQVINVLQRKKIR